MPQPMLPSERLPAMTSGLVVTLDPDPVARDSALAALGRNPAFTVGEATDHRLPVALEAEDAEASERWTEWVRGLPGVVGVEVVFVHWDEQEEVIHADR